MHPSLTSGSWTYFKTYFDCMPFFFSGILLYEMFYGYTPFRGKNRQRTFSNILQKDLKFPKTKQVSEIVLLQKVFKVILLILCVMMQVSLSGKQLMYRLLQRDPNSRLGSKEGANEIKHHPFFRGVNWALVRCMV